VSAENGNLSIVLTFAGGGDFLQMNIQIQLMIDLLVKVLLCVKSPTSVALVSVANGNLSIVL
jgi:hypothetical protein